MPTKRNTFKRGRTQRIMENNNDGKEVNCTQRKRTMANESLPTLTSVMHDALHNCLWIEKFQKTVYRTEASLPNTYNKLNDSCAKNSHHNYDDDMESVYSDFDLVNDLMQEVFFESNDDDDECNNTDDADEGDNSFTMFEDNNGLHSSDCAKLLPKRATSGRHLQKQANSTVYVGEIFDLELKPENFKVKPLITTEKRRATNTAKRMLTMNSTKIRPEIHSHNNNTKGNDIKEHREQHHSLAPIRTCNRRNVSKNHTDTSKEANKSTSNAKVTHNEHDAVLFGNASVQKYNNNVEEIYYQVNNETTTSELRPSSLHSCSSLARCKKEEECCVTSVDGRHRRKNAQSTHFLRAVHDNGVALTVVLDVDETLVYARDGCIHVRPHVDHFIHTCGRLKCELIVWTAAKPSHINPILQTISSLCKCSDWFAHIISRHRKWFTDDSNAVKDLRLLGRRQEHVLVIENNPLSILYQPENVVLVEDYLRPNDKDMTMNELCSVVQRVVELTSTQSEDGTEKCHESNREYHVSKTPTNRKDLQRQDNNKETKSKFRAPKVVSNKTEVDACSPNTDKQHICSRHRNRGIKTPLSLSALPTETYTSMSVPDALATLDCLAPCTFELRNTHNKESREHGKPNASSTLACHVLKYSPNAHFLQRSYGLMHPLDYHHHHHLEQ